MYKYISDNYSKLRLNIKKICKRINRDPNEINIVVVTKNQKVEKYRELINLGHISFGENRLESSEKWKEINKDTKLHFIGALQSKKAKNVTRFFDVIETLDSEKAAKNISNFIHSLQYKRKKPEIYIQVNIGEEEQKRGIKPTDLSPFLNMCKNNYRLDIKGAMCMAPLNKESDKYFSCMKNLCKNNNLHKISMGMSNDYENAIINGSTNVRIGSLIFNEK